MNILIVEDTIATCNFLSKVITNHYPHVHCDCSYTYDDALTKLINASYDILILDYELDADNPRKNGIALGNQLSTLEKYKQIPIIIETSYPNYIFNAVNSLNCSYYLLKPFNETDILKMLDKVFLKHTADLKLTFHNQFGIQTILSASDIIYIKSEHHTITVVTYNKIYSFVNYSLSQIEQDANNLLIRCHKSYIINPTYIANIDKINRYITMNWFSKKETIPIGRKYNEYIFERTKK